MLVLLVMCLKHAWKQGMPTVLFLIAGVIFGWLLEVVTIFMMQMYQYGDFLLMVGEVPLSVGIGWGVIIYSIRLFSDAADLPSRFRPALEGLLALNIDLAMDTVAVRLGMWSWAFIGLQDRFFGVNEGNFWAWFWVVFFFSLGHRWLSAKEKKFWRYMAPFGAIFIGLIGVVFTNAFISVIFKFVSYTWFNITIGLTLSTAFLLILWIRPKFGVRKVDSLSFWVPFSFHIYFLVVGLISKALFNSPFILVLSVGMMLLVLYLHRVTIRGFFTV